MRAPENSTRRDLDQLLHADAAIAQPGARIDVDAEAGAGVLPLRAACGASRTTPKRSIGCMPEKHVLRHRSDRARR